MPNERDIAVAIVQLQRAFAAACLKPPVALVLERGQRYPVEAVLHQQVQGFYVVCDPDLERKTSINGLEIRENR